MMRQPQICKTSALFGEDMAKILLKIYLIKHYFLTKTISLFIILMFYYMEEYSCEQKEIDSRLVHSEYIHNFDDCVCGCGLSYCKHRL